MPPINPAVTAGVIAVSVAVAAAIAVYESPELRRMADDLRRRIAEAFHSLGDGIQPPHREHPMAMPMFNRPEDAEEYLRSRGIEPGPDSGVEADEETRRRQREELMYWNRLHLEKKDREGDTEKEQGETQKPRRQIPVRGPSFDDFLQEDKTADSGTFVFNTGASVPRPDDTLVRRRGADGTSGARGLNASIWANAFGDEHGIELDETHPVMPLTSTVLSPERDEIMSETDIFGATEPNTPTPALVEVEPRPELTASPSPRAWSPLPATASLEEALENVMHNIQSRSVDGAQLLESSRQSQLGADEYVTAGQEDRSGPEAREAFESIQAWAAATAANPAFYSPLPMSPAAPLSEAEVVSVAGESDFEEVDGMVTPTDSGSVAGSGVDVGQEDGKSVGEARGEEGRYYDVVSDDESVVPTPTSWTEVGSVVSESERGGVTEYERA